MVGHRYQAWLKPGKVHLSDQVIWRKPAAPGKEHWPTYSDKTEHTTYRFGYNFEHIYIYRKEGARPVPNADLVLKSRITREQYNKWVDGVWEIDPVHSKPLGHPAVWPDRLVSRLIQMFSYEGELVLDPFLGSGTTVKVARELGREGIGYEREIQYKPAILSRLGVAPPAEDIATTMERISKCLITSMPEGQGIPLETVPERPDADLTESTNLFEINAEFQEAMIPA